MRSTVRPGVDASVTPRRNLRARSGGFPAASVELSGWEGYNDAVPLGVLQRAVSDMVSDGADLSEVEEAISYARVDEEERSALWLLAWSSRDPDRAMIPPVTADVAGGD